MLHLPSWRASRVGLALIKGDWEAAVRLILAFSNHEKLEVAAARKLYLEQGDAAGALRAMPRYCSAECAILEVCLAVVALTQAKPEVAAARKLYLETGDAAGALRVLPCRAECAVLEVCLAVNLVHASAWMDTAHKLYLKKGDTAEALRTMPCYCSVECANLEACPDCLAGNQDNRLHSRLICAHALCCSAWCCTA